ncbi:MAG TPA: hypothetical protein VIT91_11600 [Chthoniobacterales bacterium]
MRAENTAGDFSNPKDSTSDFLSQGVVTIGDKSIPSNGINDAPNNKLVIPGTNWEFRVGVRQNLDALTPYFNNDTIMRNVEVALEGTHKMGPHAADVVNNALPEAVSDFLSIPFGGAKSFTGYRRQEHPSAKHFDHYAFKMDLKLTGAVAPAAPPAPIRLPRLTATDAFVTGRHRESPTISERALWTTASSASSGSFVSFDSNTGKLSFSIGAIDVADSNGGLSGGVEPIYLNDPVLAATWAVTDLQFLGTTPEGQFRFGPGTMTLMDPAGNFTFTGHFDEYLIDDTSRTNFLTSYALFSSISIDNAVPGDAGDSPFLSDFADGNLLGLGISDSDSELFGGIDFALITGTNLADATMGFTQSVSNLPATYLMSANMVPEPSTTVLACIGLAWLFAQRRVTRGC